MELTELGAIMMKGCDRAPSGVCRVCRLPWQPPQPKERDGAYYGLLASEKADDHSAHAAAERHVVRHWLAVMDGRAATPSHLEKVVAAGHAAKSEALRKLLTGQLASKRGHEATRRWVWMEAKKTLRPHLARAVLTVFDQRYPLAVS